MSLEISAMSTLLSFFYIVQLTLLSLQANLNYFHRRHDSYRLCRTGTETS